MDLSDRRTNFRLKGEMLALVMEVSCMNPGSTQKDYNLLQEGLDAMEFFFSEQNAVLTEHLHFLQETSQRKARIQPRDSFAMPPPSALRSCGLPPSPASAVPTAAGVKRGLEGEHADLPRPWARPRPGRGRGHPAGLLLCGLRSRSATGSRPAAGRL